MTTAYPSSTDPNTQFNFATYLIALNAHRANKPAFIDDHACLTYGQLEINVKAFAAELTAIGIRREERVFVLMHDCNDWPVAFLGCLYLGVVPVAVNTLLTVDDYAYMLAHCRAQAVFVSQALLPSLASAIALNQLGGVNEVKQIVVSGGTTVTEKTHIGFNQFIDQGQAQLSIKGPSSIAYDSHAPAFWLYSSGSTGRPKGTVHTQANLYHTALLYGQGILAIKETDVCFSAAKLFFAYGLGNGLTFPLSVGATVILMAQRPTPTAIFTRWRGDWGAHTRAMQRQHCQPTIFFGAPTGFAGMLAAPDLPSKESVTLRLCSSAGEALPAELGEKFSTKFGCEIIDGIGSTEMLHVYLSNQPGRVRYGTTGWPVPGYDIQLRTEDNSVAADGEVGDLYIKGPSAALMYWGDREKTRNTFLGDWTRSGDKYVRNQDGSYTYAGRSDDMIKVSGIYVSPFEVEATLMQHNAVLEAAVIGCEDENGLTRSKAFVVLKNNQTTNADELKLFVKDRLAAYKYPRSIEFVAELPKTATGKIQRFKLRDLEKRVSTNAKIK
jgi:benzoate-CoA ligase